MFLLKGLADLIFLVMAFLLCKKGAGSHMGVLKNVKTTYTF